MLNKTNAAELAATIDRVLTDENHPLCQWLWAELERRGWVLEQMLKGELR